MCGIAGAFSYELGAAAVDRNVVERLNDLQRRRGPDGAGNWQSEDGRIVLGHRRLAIIETGPGGIQPMADVTGRWTITFNGEIYNYHLLRWELEQLGCRFRTNSDTEVLINAVAQWGEAGLRKLRGMFAFALWDNRQQELGLARDPYGIKPLYVVETHGALWFASQARALANTGAIDTAREMAALTGFYLWGHVPEPFSWWAGIQMFPAGHVQRVRLGHRPNRPVAFLRIEENYLVHREKPLDSVELRNYLFESVRCHMVADVPVGIFLSAGIDSNVIASLAAETDKRLRTVTLAFSEYAGTSDDEAPLAEAAAKVLGSEHATVRMGREEFEAVVDDFLEVMDQPSIDGLNTYLVSRAAAGQGLKVALSGLGGDELFGGYPSFRHIPRLVGLAQCMPFSIGFGRLIEKSLLALPSIGLSPKAAGVLSHAGDPARAYLLRRSLYLQNELEALIDESWLSEGLEKLATHEATGQIIEPLRRARITVHAQVAALESTWYMRNQLLRDTDWSSMAHGLEVRVPFVDAQLLQQLAPAIASKKPPNKADLAACATQLPSAIINRPKTGFTTPVRRWIGGPRSARGLRGWAGEIHRQFRSRAKPLELAQVSLPA